MGFYFRKSVGLGPIRLNLSKSGLGASFGVKGARISVGPRGTQLNVGSHGLYYRQSLGTNHHHAEAQRPSRAVSTEMQSVGSQPGPMQEQDDLVKQISVCQSRRGLAAWVLATGTVGCAVLVLAVVPIDPLLWSFVGLTLALTIPAFMWARRRDRRRLNLTLDYHLSDEASALHSTLLNALATICNCERLWAVTGVAWTADTKRNAGASRLVQRAPARLLLAMPRRVHANVPIYCLSNPIGQLYFLPDRLLFQARSQLQSLPYSDLASDFMQSPFLEGGAVPSDTRIVGHSWRYVNKDGSPDQRFANNSQVPQCLYGQLKLTNASGFELFLQTSNPDAPHSLVTALRAMAKVSRTPPDHGRASGAQSTSRLPELPPATK
jgi:hypothetical protein